MPDPSTVDGLTQSGTIIAWERQFGWRQRRVAKVFHSRGQRNLTTCQGSNQCWLGTRRVSPVLLQLPAILYSISLPRTLPLPSLSVSLVRCLRAFCSWLVVCALLCHCICVSLGYAKSITRHNRISYGEHLPPPLVSPICSLSLRLILCSIPILPFHPVPISSFRCLGVFQFDMLDRFSLI